MKKYYACRIYIEESSSIIDESLLEACNVLSKAKGVIKDMDVMVSIQEKITDDEDELKATKNMVEALRNQIRRLHCSYYSSITNAVGTCLIISDDSITIKKDHISPSEAFESLASLSSTYYHTDSSEDEHHLLKDAMKSLCIKLYNDVLSQLMTIDTTQGMIQYQFREMENETEISEDIGTTSSITLKWRIRREETASKNDTTSLLWLEILNAITHVLNFTSKYVFNDQEELCKLLGEFLFQNSCSVVPKVNIPPCFLKDHSQFNGPLVYKLLSMFYNICIPNESSSITQLNDIVSLLYNDTLDFEHYCYSKFVLPNEDPLPFASSLNSLEEKYGYKRRIVILSDARDVLLKEDYNNTIIVGSDHQHQYVGDNEIGMYPDNINPDFILNDKAKSFFELPMCSISIVASKIMKLSRDVLDEAVACSSLPDTAHMLYRTSRDVFDLYRTLIPAAHGSAIATTPRTASICHNDCVYFAHYLLTLGLEYQQKFSDTNEKLSKICSFVDIVPLFRQMAEQVMTEMITNQKLQMNELLQQLFMLHEVVRSNEAVMEWSDIEKTVRAVNYHLHHLSQSWSTPVLSNDIYGRTMGVLIDTLLHTIIKEILSSTDISEAASHFINSLFTDVIQSCNQILTQQNINQYCANYEKFIAVRKFMTMSLDDITLGLSDGVFVCLTSYELCDLICATFDDGAKRRDILNVLNQAGK